MSGPSPRRTGRDRRQWAPTTAAIGALLWLGAPLAQASVLTGDTLDRVADILAIVVLIIVPVVLIVAFWLIHILPEKVAERRHHPQKETIKVICLLSLVFGGLLWPIAWIMAYSKPVLHKLAYGTDKHEDYYREQAGEPGRTPPGEGRTPAEELAGLRAELDALADRGRLPEELQAMRARLAAMEQSVVRTPTGPGAA